MEYATYNVHLIGNFFFMRWGVLDMIQKGTENKNWSVSFVYNNLQAGEQKCKWIVYCMVYPPDLGHIVTTGHKGICKPLSTSSRPGQRSSATLWRESWPYGPWLPYHTGTQPAMRPAWSQVSGEYRGDCNTMLTLFEEACVILQLDRQACKRDSFRWW